MNESETIDIEQVERVVLTLNRNCARPADAMELLAEITAYLEQRGSKMVDGRQPYLIRDIVIDFYTGWVKLYIDPNL